MYCNVLVFYVPYFLFFSNTVYICLAPWRECIDVVIGFVNEVC